MLGVSEAETSVVGTAGVVAVVLGTVVVSVVVLVDSLDGTKVVGIIAGDEATVVLVEVAVELKSEGAGVVRLVGTRVVVFCMES